MKHLMSFALVLFTSLSVMAGDGELEKFFSKHKNQEGFQSLTLTSDVFKMLSNITEAEEGEFSDLFDGIESVNILKFKSKDQSKADSYIKEFSSIIDNRKYDELVSMFSGDVDILAKAITTDDYVENLVVILKDKEEYGFVYINGRIPFDRVREVIQQIK